VTEEGAFWKINVNVIDREEGSHVIIDADISVYLSNGDTFYNLPVKSCKLYLEEVPHLEGKLYTEVYSENTCSRIERSDNIGIVIFEPSSTSERRQAIDRLRYHKEEAKEILQHLNLRGPGVKIEFWPKDADSWAASRCFIYDVTICSECGGPKLAQLPCRECGSHPTPIKWIAFLTTAPSGQEVNLRPRYWRRWNPLPASVGGARAEMMAFQDDVTYETVRSRVRKIVTKASRVIIGGGTHKGLYVLRPSSIKDYRKVLDPEDDEAQ
jgi:hypothetical protein